MAFRRLSSANSTSGTDLEENDDEAEKEERRSRSVSTASKSSSSSNSSFSNLSPLEIDIQIAQCLKLNAENKINDKNAFQLKLIDFLAYALKKHDPKISNLLMASACLDASGKIYGYRVDKVHSDLLKIVGASRGEKRQLDDEQENLIDQNGNAINQPKKRRKKTVLCTVEATKGSVETYNPLSVINQRDVQTSDSLGQASLPMHANQGIALNLYNDVILDKLPISRYNSSNFLVPRIENFSCNNLCPSYDTFKFLGWSVDDDPMDTNEPHENDGEHHFDIDGPIEDNDKSINMLDYRDNQEERFDKIAQNHENQQPLIDFQDIISNHTNPDVTYEYSYMHDNYSIHLVKPSHWKVHIKKDIRYNGGTGSPKKVRRKKDVQLEFTEYSKEEAETRFVLANKPLKLIKDTIIHWSEDRNTLPQFIQYDMTRFSSYFNNTAMKGLLNSHEKIENEEEDMRKNFDEDDDDIQNFSKLVGCHDNDDINLTYDEQENQIPVSVSELPSQEAFVGENLVALPKLTENNFISYSQRAKKIDIRQLKKSIWKILESKESKEFSHLYRILPVVLTSTNAQSLSPGLAFSSLLHVSHEKTLVLRSHSNYADLTIRNCKET